MYIYFSMGNKVKQKTYFFPNGCGVKEHQYQMIQNQTMADQVCHHNINAMCPEWQLSYIPMNHININLSAKLVELIKLTEYPHEGNYQAPSLFTSASVDISHIGQSPRSS